MKTIELTGRALDYAVALAEHGQTDVEEFNFFYGEGCNPDLLYSSNKVGDDIIDREMISTQVYDASFKPDHMWGAYLPGQIPYTRPATGPTRRIAAMRAWVMHKLGPEIDIPKELQ